MKSNAGAARLLAAICLLTGLLSPAAAQTIKIGLIGAMTGPGAPWGLAMSGAAKIAASEVNARGGLEVGNRKLPIEIIAYDDQFKAADAVAAYNRLTRQDGAKYAFLMTSASTLAVKDSAENDKVIVLTSSGTPKAIDANTKYVFRLYSAPQDFAPAIAGWMKSNLKERNVVIVNPNDETGWILSQAEEAALKQNGFNVLASELYERTIKDFQPLLTKMLALKPDIIDISSAPPGTAGLLVRQGRDLGFKGRFLKTGGSAPMDIVAAAGKEGAEGVINMLYADPANAGYRRLVDDYRKAYGHEPNEIVVSFYDGINVLLRAIQKAGDPDDTAKVSAAFSQALPMKSLQGEELTLGGKDTSGVNHQVMSVNYLGIIRNGVPVSVGMIR
jgi:branched-chain amino acid transport system substrate-binding protein